MKQSMIDRWALVIKARNELTARIVREKEVAASPAYGSMTRRSARHSADYLEGVEELLNEALNNLRIEYEEDI